MKVIPAVGEVSERLKDEVPPWLLCTFPNDIVKVLAKKTNKC